MDDEVQGLRRQLGAIASAPLLFAVAVLALAAVVWGVLHLSYQAVLSSKDRHIAALERRIAEYRDVVAGATPDEARRRIEAMELELTTLRLRLQPRRITAEQRQAILDRSRLPAGAAMRAVTVVTGEDCSDCAAFAAELAAALHGSQGWTVNTATASKLPVTRAGLAIRVADRLRPPPDAMVLRRALQSAGLEHAMLGGAAGAEVELLVSERAPQ
jgi:hypothetical protein